MLPWVFFDFWRLHGKTHFSLDVHRDAQEQRHVEAHFHDVIPVLGFRQRLWGRRERQTTGRHLDLAVTEAFLSSCWQGLWPLQCVPGEKDLKICSVSGGKETLESLLCPEKQPWFHATEHSQLHFVCRVCVCVTALWGSSEHSALPELLMALWERTLCIPIKNMHDKKKREKRKAGNALSNRQRLVLFFFLK